MKVKELNKEEHPREKALQHGIVALSDRELLILVLRGGTRSVSALELADEVLRYWSSMGDLGKANMQELMGLSGIKETRAISLLMAFELEHRITFDEVLRTPSTHYPQGILGWVNQQIGSKQQEHFLVLFLNQRNQLISSHMMFVGTLTNTSMHPREIFREAMQLGCAKILCVHNHPSGDPQSSSADISLTRSIEGCGVMTAIPLMDHIIISRNMYFGLAQKELLQPGLSQSFLETLIETKLSLNYFSFPYIICGKHEEIGENMSKLNRFQKIILSVIAFFVVIGILLRSVSGSVTSSVGYGVVTMLKYVLIDYPIETVRNLFSDFANLWNVNEENDRLRYKLNKNPSYRAKYVNEKQKNTELEEALSIRTSDNAYKRIWAKVILRGQATWNNKITVDKGSREDVKAGMTVESTNSMVGKIKSVSAHTNAVKLLTSEDKLNSAPVKILLDEKKGSLGVLQSYDVRRGCYTVSPFDNSGGIKKGMQVVTSGKDGGHPNRLLIGTVDSVQVLSNQTGQTIYVRSIDDFQTFPIASAIVEKRDE